MNADWYRLRWFVLADRFSIPVAVLQEVMPGREFSEWIIYDRIKERWQREAEMEARVQTRMEAG